MQVLLLSGGSGKRLWPLSNEVRSKQFLQVLKSPSGESESMVQRVYRQIREAGITSELTIASNRGQKESLQMQLGSSVNLVLEPERRDTFPAIALACTYLHLKKDVPLDEVVVVLPVDVYADLDYFKTLIEMEKVILNGEADMALMGITPDSPSEKYGYILPEENIRENVIRVKGFSEKPDTARAQMLVDEGAFWNGGVFAFSLGYLLKDEKFLSRCDSFEQRLEDYGQLKKTSFDYEVVEQCDSLAMVPYSGQWKDLGSWNVLTSVIENSPSDTILIEEDFGNTHIINELDIPVLALGTKNMIICSSFDGILVADLDHCSNLKEHAQKLTAKPRREQFLWGSSHIVDITRLPDGTEAPLHRIVVNGGMTSDVLLDNDSSSVLTILFGNGEISIDDEKKEIERGDVLEVAKGVSYRLSAESEMVVLKLPVVP